MWSQYRPGPRRHDDDPHAVSLFNMPTLPPVVQGLRGRGTTEGFLPFRALRNLPRATTAPAPNLQSAVSAAAPVATQPLTPATPPPLPSWAKPQVEKKQKNIDAAAANRKIVAEANARGTRFDFVLYGDSITRNIRDKYQDVWTRFFGKLNTVPLGVGGHTVQELSYRLAKGGELLTTPPKVVGLLIGINNLKPHLEDDPAGMLDSYLLPYLKAVYPGSRILLLGLLPNLERDVAPTNVKYKAVAAKHGVDFVQCGSDIDPANVTHLADGTHPAAEGYARIFTCLQPVVNALVRRV